MLDTLIFIYGFIAIICWAIAAYLTIRKSHPQLMILLLGVGLGLFILVFFLFMIQSPLIDQQAVPKLLQDRQLA